MILLFSIFYSYFGFISFLFLLPEKEYSLNDTHIGIYYLTIQGFV